MNKFIFLILSVFLVFLVHCSTKHKTIQPTLIPDEKCDIPIVNIGDSWRYRNDLKKEWEFKVIGIEDFKKTKIYIVEDVYGIYKRGYDVKTLKYIVDIAPNGRKIVPMTDWTLSLNFPLYVGKKWSEMVSGKDAENNPRNYLYTYKIVSFENITVLAGEFKAFKIEFTQVSYATSSEIKVYIWYSPEVKREVKFQYGPAYGRVSITGQGYELKSFKLADKQTVLP
jgi:hypothetical protein